MRSRMSFGLVVLFLFPCLAFAQTGNRVTILYDAFGKSPAVKKAWGFSALVEYGGKRILFDTGGNAETFERVERVLEAAAKIDPHVRVLFGGIHLVSAPDADVQRITAALRDQEKLDYVAVGHCTGEPAFAALQKAFAERYLYAGLGTVVNVP